MEGFAWNESAIVEKKPIAFYHFHEFKDAFTLTNYPLRPIDRKLIYEPYIEAIHAAKDRIKSAKHVQA